MVVMLSLVGVYLKKMEDILIQIVIISVLVITHVLLVVGSVKQVVVVIMV